jgi:hypothetical protein
MDALTAECLAATDAERDVLSFCVVRTIHQEISLNCSIRDSI